MKEFVAERPNLRDSRFVVIPGVLHTSSQWGAGTTEYAMEAVKYAAEGLEFRCPIPLDETLPMIFVDDLLRGLHAAMIAPRWKLLEPESGYAAAGFSFTPRELFDEIRKYFPEFKYLAGDAYQEPVAAKCSASVGVLTADIT